MQFLVDLKAFAGPVRWREISQRMSIALLRHELEAGSDAETILALPHASTVFTGQHPEGDSMIFRSIIYIDAPGFISNISTPTRVLVGRDPRVYHSIRQFYDYAKASGALDEKRLETWMADERAEARFSPLKVPDVFISYSSKDIQRMLQVRELLEKMGLNPWSDRDIGDGMNWRETLLERVKSAHCGVLLHSSNSINSEWVRVEAAALGAANDNRLLIVRLDDTDLSPDFEHMQARLSLKNWNGDLQDPEAFAVVLAVEARLEKRSCL